jgi:hypothetical protein
MFEGLKRKIAHYLVRRKYLRKNIQQLVFTNIISDSHDLFIVMPKEDKDFFHSLDILKYYQIHKKIITLFLPEYKYSLIPEKEKFKFISYHPHQITRFNLPDKNLVGRLTRKEFDIVIDLNRKENVFFSAISNIVQSKIRVSFEKELSGRYYTMQITDKQSDPELSYRSFLSYLKMF